ncbi:MAG TPA: acetate kinase [Rhodocyclaceae bacterium]|nr:acetate kinase [Rhodocyclaceae bacterium]
MVRSSHWWHGLWGRHCGSALFLMCSGLVHGADLTADQEQVLRSQIDEQSKRLESLRLQMMDAEVKLTEIRQQMNAPHGGTTSPGPAKGTTSSVAPQASSEATALVTQDTAPPTDGRPQQVAQIFEQPGVLTPKGQVVLEPAMQYGYSSSNRVSIVGYTIIPALTIGLINVVEVKRNTFTGSLTGRWGITNRLELEAKLPYVYRSDDVLSRPINSGASSDQLFSSTGRGIGDVEVTGRYQLNNGGLDSPYYVGTLRFKSRTGKDPFEVLTDTLSAPSVVSNQIQKELPTGSGFYTLQPGLTVLYPTDPAVFFGSVSYQYNFKRSGVTMNTTQGPLSIGDVKPGDVLGFNFGIGLALNDRSSFSIGYDHASVGKTRINGTDALNSVRTELGTLLLGYAYRINNTTSLNVSVGVGVTRDTPDVTLSVRLPMTF